MWMYAISIFLISLTPGSFLFTAIYGLAVSLSVVAFGTLVGDWIDVTPRLKGILIIFLRPRHPMLTARLCLITGAGCIQRSDSASHWIVVL
jgi:hypothetical protein